MKDKFYKFFEKFQETPQWASMANTCEASPYHREPNVGIHTTMVLSEFEKIQDVVQLNITAATVARLALLFHDVGKPAARTRKESVERGVYHSYPGHEQKSARDLEDYAATNWDMLQAELHLADWYQVYAATYLVEIHLPYDIKHKDKRAKLATAVKSIEDTLSATGLFAAVLRSDARGRISDDMESKLQKVETWIAEFYALEQFQPA